MSPSPHSYIVLIAAAIAFSAAAYACHRREVADRAAFVWLMVAIGAWSLLSGVHGLAPTLTLKVAAAKAQYLPIMSVPLLWFAVANRVIGRPALSRPQLLALAVVPLLTVAAAWTNDWHGWLWSRITLSGGTLVYHHGPWFWVAVAFNYGLLAIALFLLVRTMRHTPPAFHGQLRVIVGAACVPWLGNILYLSRAVPIPGLDPTPLAFTLTGLLFLWALTGYQFLDLMPTARGAVFDHLDDGVLVVDQAGRLVDANAAARRLGALASVAIGQPVERVTPRLAGAIVASLQGAAPVLAEPFGPDAVSIEVRARPLSSAGAATLGWLVTLRDITTQQALVRQLRAEHDFSRQLMQSMGEGLTVVDEGGRFTFVNDAYARLTGYTPAELVGRTPWSMAAPEDQALLGEAWARRAEGQASSYTTRLRRADGRLVTVQITGTPRLVDGSFAGSVAVITDLTERLAQEEALRTAEQTLRSFFDSAGVMMGIVELGDEDVLHVADNALAAAFFGATVEAIRGQWASVLGATPQTIQRWLRAYHESDRTGLPVQFDYAHETPEGHRWLAVTVCRIGPASSGRVRCSYVALDVTERKVVEHELRRSQQQLETANAQLSELARTDGLTGLRNRGAFDEQLVEAVIRARAFGVPLSLLLIDIDHFKSYNDSFGHVAGDGVLRAVGRIFQEQARQSDLVARYGGEEFAVILPNTDEAESLLVAERIRRSVGRVAWPEREITVSVGVATFRAPLAARELVELADGALYHAKEQGRNRVAHASQVMIE